MIVIELCLVAFSGGEGLINIFEAAGTRRNITKVMFELKLSGKPEVDCLTLMYNLPAGN